MDGRQTGTNPIHKPTLAANFPIARDSGETKWLHRPSPNSQVRADVHSSSSLPSPRNRGQDFCETREYERQYDTPVHGSVSPHSSRNCFLASPLMTDPSPEVLLRMKYPLPWFTIIDLCVLGPPGVFQVSSTMHSALTE